MRIWLIGNDREKSYRVYAAKVNPGLHLGRNPYRVCYMFKGYSIPAFVTVMCHDEQGGCALNPVDFTKFKDYAELF